MCGFTGIIDRSAATPAPDLRTTVRAMADTLAHRGPDDDGQWADCRSGVALGFRRLAILDLTEAGHQPFISADGSLALVFNGEIYNHAALRAELQASGAAPAWRGHSDTETLIACFGAWGVRPTLEKTVGMFALALWDGQARRLHLARDRFGEKPLYYGWSGGALVFGSELKALRRYPGFDNDIDRDALALFTQYSSVPAPYSIYRGIYKLEPGCVLSLSTTATAPGRALFAPARQDGIVLERYWSLSEVARRGQADRLTDEREAIDRLEAALTEAVRLQSIADVPLGALLSGGIDSSLVVALMQARSNRQVKTFTIGFGEAGFNEAEHAKAVARHLGTDHTELYLSAQQALEVIPRLPRLYSEPFADSSQIPTYLVSQMARQHVTVALSGDGGDELLGGYTRYVWGTRVWRQLRWMPRAVRRGLGATIAAIPESAWDTVGRAVPGGGLVAQAGGKAHKLAHRLKNVAGLDDLYRALVRTWPADANLVVGARRIPLVLDHLLENSAGLEPQHRMMLWDALTYMPDDILHKVDRAAMAVSLETRAPLLDHRIAELAWRLPLDMKIRQGQGKWIARQVLYRHVPRTLVERPKMGFGMPVAEWLRGPLRDWAEDLLSERRLTAQGLWHAAPIRRKWTEHLSGAASWPYELWCVLMFQEWLEAAD
jgi:asparagine synthase (glutamine-hydrolysing)